MNLTIPSVYRFVCRSWESTRPPPRRRSGTHTTGERTRPPPHQQAAALTPRHREARKWHPDKNKHDPQAEARFKLISEAYEVLSNPAKRKAYEEGGREGLDAAEAADNIDVKSVVRALFGGGEFDDIMGDVGEIPILRRMVERSDDMMRDDQADEGKELTEEEKRRKELSDKVSLPHPRY